jgi:hypothetical protein
MYVLKHNRIIAWSFVVFSLLIMVYSIRYLPLIDFRAYAVGKNIQEGMQIPEDAPQPEFKEIWYYKIDGKVKEFSSDKEPWNIPGAEFVDRKTITISEGYIPPIHDFTIENETEGDITELVLQKPEIYLIIAYEPKNISDNVIKIINDYAESLQNKNKKVIGMFSITDSQLEQKFSFPIYLTDATTLKTMIRSNPGVIKLENGTVTMKKSWRSL